MTQIFVVPALAGPATGGTLYNSRLVSALREIGEAVTVVPELRTALASDRLGAGAGDVVWIDSLYLGHVPALRERLAPKSQLGLLIHYLPSLLLHAPPLTRERLLAEERAALSLAERVITPSPFMVRTLRGLVPYSAKLQSLEPGCEVTLAPEPPRSAGLRALMVANLVPNKRVEPFLRAFARSAPEQTRFVLRIAGHSGADPEYARRCTQLIERSPLLRESVELLGSVPWASLVRAYAEHHVLVSSSQFESYGMALAEARSAGLPVLACSGGNVENLVTAETGGEVHSDPEALAIALADWLGSPERRERSRQLARQNARPPRPWRQVAQELVQSL